MNNSTTTTGHQEQCKLVEWAKDYNTNDKIIAVLWGFKHFWMNKANAKRLIYDLKHNTHTTREYLAKNHVRAHSLDSFINYNRYWLNKLINKLHKDMETKEVKIEIPEGYEIDKENSTFECIKFKKRDVSWRSTETNDSNYINKMSGYTIGVGSEPLEVKNWLHTKFNRFLFATEKQAKSALAMAQISQIMANDERFGGVVKELDFGNTCAKRFWQIQRIKLKSEKPYIAINQVDASYNYSVLIFYKLEQAVLFLEENEDLVKDYLMID